MTKKHTPVDPHAAANEARREGRLEDAARLYREVLQKQPEHIEAWQALASVELARGRLDEAADAAQQAVDRCGADSDHLLLLGKAQELRERYSEAKAAYAEACKLEPERQEAVLGIARTLLAQGDPERARAAVEKVLAFDPERAGAHGVLADILVFEAEPEAALAAVEAGIDLDPGLASLHNSRGMALQLLNRLEAAQDAFGEAVRLAPRVAALHFNMGCNLLRLRHHAKARGSFERAIELKQDFGAAHIRLGVALEAEKSPQEAVKAYQRAIRFAPRDPDAHRHLGKLLLGVERYDEAKVCFQNVLRIDPNDPEGLEGLADIFREKRLPEKAIPFYRRAAEHGSASAAHFLSALSGERTAAPPREYVESLFDGYSEDFEEHLTETLGYEVPRQLRDLLVETVGKATRFEHGLDLGCGTGLAGLVLGPLVEVLEGVDLSADMLRLAERKSVYARLHRGDLVDFLSDCDNRYDLLFAADVFIYLGDLEALFGAVRRCAAPRAYFAFSVEHTPSADYHLRESGRYAHSRSYIEVLAEMNSFKIGAHRIARLRKEDDQWLRGTLFVLQSD